MMMQGSAPSTHASCPGGAIMTSPGPKDSFSPPSICTVMRPDMTKPMCGAWQLSVPAIGFTCSDQRQPGLNVARPTAPLSVSTSSSCPDFPSNDRVSPDVTGIFLSCAPMAALPVEDCSLATVGDRVEARSGHPEDEIEDDKQQHRAHQRPDRDECKLALLVAFGTGRAR